MFDGLDGDFEELHLVGNSLTALPAGIFDGLTGLHDLDLSCNKLATLPLDRFDPAASAIEFLDISGNSFTTPPTDQALRAKLPNLSSLHTGSNTLCLPGNEVRLGVSAPLALYRQDSVTRIPTTEIESITLGAHPGGYREWLDDADGFSSANEYIIGVTFKGGCSHTIDRPSLASFA